jgi:hypothetical protein
MITVTIDYLEKNVRQVINTLSSSDPITIVSSDSQKTVLAKITSEVVLSENERQKLAFIETLKNKQPITDITWTRSELYED